MRLVPFSKLETAYDIPYTRQHLRRLAKAGKFPKPVKVTEDGRSIAWIDEEIEEHLRQRAAARNAPRPDKAA